MGDIKYPFKAPNRHDDLKIKKESKQMYFEASDGLKYFIHNGVTDLTFPKKLTEKDEKVRKFYDARAEVYDKFLPLTFKTYSQNEQKCREQFVDALELKKNSKVLDIACGTGRDSEIIANRLSDKGELCLQDISPEMLNKCIERLKKTKVSKHYCIANASYLPFPDKYFDATFSFGGLGEFSDIKQALAEMVRVTKVGGKIVVGDESMPPWLRETEFCKILSTTNPQFLAELPLNHIPVEAREVNLKWVIGGVFYLIDFRVGKGEPEGDFDFQIPGIRGGTLRSRYEGQLEGVKKATKEKAWKHIAEMDTNMHDWLDGVVNEAIKRQSGKK
jgi:ubiquinone/menaquinone biosynthesis C-methylase UbiE